MIDENGNDKHGRELTKIVVTEDVALDQFQIITNPSHTVIDGYRFWRSRRMCAINVVKLKGPRKPKQANASGNESTSSTTSTTKGA